MAEKEIKPDFHIIYWGEWAFALLSSTIEIIDEKSLSLEDELLVFDEKKSSSKDKSYSSDRIVLPISTILGINKVIFQDDCEIIQDKKWDHYLKKGPIFRIKSPALNTTGKKIFFYAHNIDGPMALKIMPLGQKARFFPFLQAYTPYDEKGYIPVLDGLKILEATIQLCTETVLQ